MNTRLFSAMKMYVSRFTDEYEPAYLAMWANRNDQNEQRVLQIRMKHDKRAQGLFGHDMWCLKVIVSLLTDKKVNAIKEVRHNTQLSLVSAKYVVDYIQYWGAKHKLLPSSFIQPIPLDDHDDRVDHNKISQTIDQLKPVVEMLK